MWKKFIRFIVEVSIFASIGLVLEIVCSYIPLSSIAWLNGGSISIACVPLFIAAYRNKLSGGILCGLLIGTLQLLFVKGSYIIHPFQVFLDFIFPFIIIGVFASFSTLSQKTQKKFLKIVILLSSLLLGFTFKILSQTLSGVLYWEYTFIPSLIYNGSYNLFSFILSSILIVVLSHYPILESKKM